MGAPPDQGGGSPIANLLPFAMMFVILYLWIIRPMLKKRKAHIGKLPVFLNRCCRKMEQSKVSHIDLFNAYQRWCKINSIKPLLNNRELRTEIQKIGFILQLEQGDYGWDGLEILDEMDHQDQRNKIQDFETKNRESEGDRHLEITKTNPDESTSVIPASAEFVGKVCPLCQNVIEPKISLIICPECKTPHHQECWEKNDGCTTFGCQRSSD
jgi:hypothetical protein